MKTIGTQSVSAGGVSAVNTARVIIAPALNTSGLIIHRANFNGVFGVGLFSWRLALCALATAPINTDDGAFAYGENYSIGLTAIYNTGQIDDVFIPAGLGIYLIANGAMSDSAALVNYTPL